MFSVLVRSFVFVFALLITVPAMAENLNIDLTTLSPDVAAALIKDIQDKQNAKKVIASVTPSQAHEWAGVGKEVAAAISETAKGLSLEVNQFVNTPVGWWAMFFLVWMLLGAKLVKITLGSAFILIAAFTWWRSMRHFYWGDYEFANGEMQGWCAFFHAVGAGFLLIVTCVLIFGVL